MTTTPRRLLRAQLLLTCCAALACTASEEQHGGETHTAAHWGYEGEEGPEFWGSLSPDYALCDTGTEQSPIDLTNATTVDQAAIERRYGSTTATIARHEHVVDILDNGHTVQVTYDEGSHLVVDGVEFDLVQFHFHAPSEHILDGRHFPMELHLVHQSPAGDLAVIGVFIAEGEHHEAFQGLIESLPAAPGEERHLEHVQIDVDAFVPETRRAYRYDGSLTTPPCSEGVRWAVLAETLELSAEQIAAIDAAMPQNNRPVQPLNSRELFLVSR